MELYCGHCGNKCEHHIEHVDNSFDHEFGCHVDERDEVYSNCCEMECFFDSELTAMVLVEDL